MGWSTTGYDGTGVSSIRRNAGRRIRTPPGASPPRHTAPPHTVHPAKIRGSRWSAPFASGLDVATKRLFPRTNATSAIGTERHQISSPGDDVNRSAIRRTDTTRSSDSRTTAVCGALKATGAGTSSLLRRRRQLLSLPPSVPRRRAASWRRWPVYDPVVRARRGSRQWPCRSTSASAPPPAKNSRRAAP